MNFLSLVGVELKKIRRSKILLILQTDYNLLNSHSKYYERI